VIRHKGIPAFVGTSSGTKAQRVERHRGTEAQRYKVVFGGAVLEGVRIS